MKNTVDKHASLPVDDPTHRGSFAQSRLVVDARDGGQRPTTNERVEVGARHSASRVHEQLSLSRRRRRRDDDGRDDDGRDDDGFVETNERRPTRIRGDGARGRYDERDGRDDDDDGSAVPVLTMTMTMTMTMRTFRERCARRRRLR
jgi:hypothetical protein